ncbi:Zinc finger PHD-type protein [Macrophomina phaseolina MS6]|uniref:Zinc finger PHD-type protein n=1 Tax=Macrophomina phaseolina (strain MS6) TaxID=1126212 RepID=K2RRX9_MACPH|nr:Zinc finger PHD-type protein [Macrophomina phaseolina MS6]
MPTTQAHAHPDAQATVTDFLDYTEFYPSDLARSLTLIEKLDKLYHDATNRVHTLTITYGNLPKLPQADRPDPQQLRNDISKALIDAERFRESAYAEAARLYENTERHATRLVTIKKKLQALPEPPSRDPTPVPVPSPQTTRSRKSDVERTPRITLHLETPRPRPTSTARVQKHRERKRKRAQEAARGIVSGQMLDRNPDSPQPSSEWDDGQSELEGEVDIDTVSGVKIPKIKNPKQKPPKSGRTPRQPGMGTNVHSSVAGISTSNALAQLTPPPPDAQPGSKYAPWHKLTEYEMAVLRKTMKKNAIWQPSDTMIRRELSSKGRGWENYKKARERAEETGEPFLDESPMDPNKEVLDPGETSFKPLGKEDNNLINRGMKLNEMKKLKREAQLREVAARDAQEIEDASRRMAEASNVIKNVFDGPAPTPVAVVKDKTKSARKRKRDSTPDASKKETKDGSSQPPDTISKPPGPKKLKLGPPAPPKIDTAGTPSPTTVVAQASPDTKASTTQVPLAPEGPSSPHAPSGPPTRHQTPTLQSPTEARIPSVPPTAAGSRSRRTSVAPKASTPLEGGSTAEEQAHPRSRAGSSSKAASTEPPIKRESRELRELRRGSNVSVPSPADQLSTGAAPTSISGSGVRLSVRRSKRPAPGAMTEDKKVVIGRRSSAPKKKGRKTEDKTDPMQHEAVEDIDPNEPRYCICGDVSYGHMIACDNDNCEKEWFHLACVGLAEGGIKRREHWFCPPCRALLRVDSRGDPLPNDVKGKHMDNGKRR